MTASREQDERLLLALALLAQGRSMKDTAGIVRKDPSNLLKLVRAVFTADMYCCDPPAEVIQHYPLNLRPMK